jgi:hypothetical protein
MIGSVEDSTQVPLPTFGFSIKVAMVVCNAERKAFVIDKGLSLA